MNKLETPTMEGEIQMEEPDSSPKPNAELKVKSDTKINFSAVKGKGLSIIKSAKLKTIFLLLFVLILVFTGIVLLSSNKTTEPEISPEIFITSPKPQNTVKDPKLKEVEEKLDDYDKKVDQLGNSLDNYQPPQIDLNINF